MEGEFQDQGHIYQYLEDWLSPIWIQPDRGLFSEEDKQEYIQIEGSVSEESIKSN